MMARNEEDERPKKTKIETTKFSCPDKNTFEFMFKRTYSGYLRLCQFKFTLISWTLCLHFKNNFELHDSRMVALFLFATTASWVYSIFGIMISFVEMQKRLHDLLRRIMIVCCSLTCAVFCLVASSVLADYAYRLRKDSYLCTKYEVCGHLIVSVLFGFLAMVCFVTDAAYELYTLNKIRENAIFSRNLQNDTSTVSSNISS